MAVSSSRDSITRWACGASVSFGSVLVMPTAMPPAARAAFSPVTASSMMTALSGRLQPMRRMTSKYTSGAGLPCGTILALTIRSLGKRSIRPALRRLCSIFSGEPEDPTPTAIPLAFAFPTSSAMKLKADIPPAVSAL
eukprot:CAMPEP_0177790970 /NCGR_PEP_ID=MMETSP0491_2-20121128/23661_1 /TAXON_ID=63592 /ORGANISM="Tetraselmis chuii, Strain PLY429" /LENGTH=137 /DNA_ID=CAMNT_0019313125 /DNA_START=97 /DNA_END=510 /DNA_ORIENTATION=+